MKNKFQDRKLPLVDEVIELDVESRKTQQEADNLRANRKSLSKKIGELMAKGKKEEAEEVKAQVNANANRLAELESKETELLEKITKIMMVIPNIIDSSVPIGKDDSENVEIKKYGEPVVPDFEVPYHAEIMDNFNGLDLDSARKVAGKGAHQRKGESARRHTAEKQDERERRRKRG
ncbi:serine--tRNA ligase, partial [Lachnotalea glycerini]